MHRRGAKTTHDSPWRYRCPSGHTWWRRSKFGYKCYTCGVEFDHLRDMGEERL